VSHAMLAAIAYKQGKCDAAVLHYRESRNAIATKPDALTQFGECLLKQQQAEDAIAVLTQVVSLEPDQWWPRYNLASVELFRHQTGDAIQTLDPALSASPVRPEVLDLAAAVYESSGDTPHAVRLLRRAILTQPKNENLYLHFADLCFDHQSFQVGIDMIDAGLTQLPESARMYLARGILRVQLGDFKTAEQDFDRADTLDNHMAISGAAASLAELESSNLPKALEIARTTLKTNPSDPMLHYVKAETLKRLGFAPNTAEFREAVDSASAAVRLKPGFLAARNLLGSLYLQQNQLPLATAQFEEVLRQDPANETALYHLLQASRKTGQSERAASLLARLVQARKAQRQSEEAAARYRLIEVNTPPPAQPR
jgi:tetratricopeptide (TPR) repeat protein